MLSFKGLNIWYQCNHDIEYYEHLNHKTYNNQTNKEEHKSKTRGHMRPTSDPGCKE